MDLEERIKQFEQLVAEDAENDMAWFSLGSAYNQAGRFAEAADAFLKCIEQNEAMSKGYQLAGAALMASGKTDEAADVLKKGYVEQHGGEFSLGAAENPQFSDAPFYVPPERIEQAKRIIAEGEKRGVDFALPMDVMLESGEIVEHLQPDQAQFDVGPRSCEEFEKKVAEFIEMTQPGNAEKHVVAFYNGVFGKFEEERFAGGTKRFVQQLEVLQKAGVEVYVGGGEGGKAVEKYLGADKVTHVFTAGGTVLNALGSEPVPYLIALRMAAENA